VNYLVMKDLLLAQQAREGILEVADDGTIF
jgi:hypothetical protein